MKKYLVISRFKENLTAIGAIEATKKLLINYKF